MSYESTIAKINSEQIFRAHYVDNYFLRWHADYYLSVPSLSIDMIFAVGDGWLG